MKIPKKKVIVILTIICMLSALINVSTIAYAENPTTIEFIFNNAKTGTEVKLNTSCYDKNNVLIDEFNDTLTLDENCKLNYDTLYNKLISDKWKEEGSENAIDHVTIKYEYAPELKDKTLEDLNAAGVNPLPEYYYAEGSIDITKDNWLTIRTITLTDTYTVPQGTVTDSEGNAVNGVNIVIKYRYKDTDEYKTQTVVSSEGRYTAMPYASNAAYTSLIREGEITVAETETYEGYKAALSDNLNIVLKKKGESGSGGEPETPVEEKKIKIAFINAQPGESVKVKATCYNVTGAIIEESKEVLLLDENGETDYDSLYQKLVADNWNSEEADTEKTIDHVTIEYEYAPGLKDKTLEDLNAAGVNPLPEYYYAEGSIDITKDNWLTTRTITLTNTYTVPQGTVTDSEGNTVNGADIVIKYRYKDTDEYKTHTVVSSEGRYTAMPYASNAAYTSLIREGEITVAETETYEGYKAALSDNLNIVLEKKSAARLGVDYNYGENITNNGYVKTAGKYNIKGVNGSQLSTELNGTYAENIEISIDEEGNVPRIFVKRKDGTTSLPVSNIIKIDKFPPIIIGIDSVLETDGGNKINFTNHGMYTNNDAKLTIKAAATDNDSGIEKMYISAKDERGNIKKYEAKTISSSNDYITCSFVIEKRLQSILKEELYICLVDKVGNESELKLIRSEKDPSTLTIEDQAPSISGYKEDGTCSEYGWFSSEVNISFDISDVGSGIKNIRMYINNNEAISEDYSNKVSGKNYSYKLTKELISKLENEEGKYTVSITTTDNAGNTATQVHELYADIIKPEVTLEGITEGFYYKTTPTLEISSNEKYYNKEGAKINVTINRNDKKISETDYEKANRLSLTSQFQKDGHYKVVVTATDAAGNISDEKTVSFVKDATAPTVQISGAENNKYYNKTRTISIKIDETNFSSNKVYITVNKTVDGKTTRENFNWKNKGYESINSRAFKGTGTYTIKAYAIDKAGNRSATKSLKFTVDSVKPVIKINNITNKIYGYNDIVSPLITITDSFYKENRTTLTKNYGQPTVAKGESRNTKGVVIKYSNLKKVRKNDGIYTLKVTATDKAGNSSSKDITFSVNRFGSTFSYNGTIKSINGKYIKKVPEDLIIYEYNVSDLSSSTNEMKKDGEDLIGTALTSRIGTHNGMKAYTHTFRKENFSEDGVYTINVISKDRAGNSTEAKSLAGKIKFYIDNTKPVLNIDSLSESLYNANKINIKVKAVDSMSDSRIEVAVNGKEPETLQRDKDGVVTFEIGNGMNQDVKITAVDAAGNTETFEKKVSVVSNDFIFFVIKNKWMLITALVIVACAICFVIFKRKGNQNEE